MMLAHQCETQEEKDNDLTGWSEQNKEKVFPQTLLCQHTMTQALAPLIYKDWANA